MTDLQYISPGTSKMDWRLLLAPLGVIALLAIATNDGEEENNGSHKRGSKRILSPSRGSDNHLSPARSRSERMGIELESILISRERAESDAEAERNRHRLESSDCIDARSPEKETRRSSIAGASPKDSSGDICKLDNASAR